MIIKHGANFRGLPSFGGIFITLIALFFLFTIEDFSSVYGVFVVVLYAFMVFVGVNMFLGFEGIQFDLKKQMVRPYHSVVGFRIGSWIPLSEFDQLTLHIDRFSVGTSTPYTSGAIAKRRVEHHRTFDIRLVGTKHPKGFLLAECASYIEGKAKLDELAAELQFSVKDECIEELQRSKGRRKNRRR